MSTDAGFGYADLVAVPPEEEPVPDGIPDVFPGEEVDDETPVGSEHPVAAPETVEES